MHQGNGFNRRIAIIDDEQAVRVGLSSLLRSVGYQTLLFDSAEVFLSSPQLHEVDYLVLDIKLSQMSGLALYQRLLERHIHIPCAFISGHADESMQQQIEQQFAQILLTKPVDVNALLASIANVFSTN